MTPQQRKQELLTGLNATKVERVALNIAHVIQAIGLIETERLCLWCIEMTTKAETNQKRFLRMPINKRYFKEGYGGFNRTDVIEAIHATTRNNNTTRTEELPPGSTAGDSPRTTQIVS